MAGGIIAYPTETFYGLCVNPFNADAVQALYRLKGRPSSSPMPLIIGGISMIRFVAKELPPQAVKLMKRFWPGPLTIVLKAADSLPASVTAGTGTIGVRLPGCPSARRFSNALGFPITSTSANPSGEKPPVTAEEVAGYFNGSISLLIDGGRLKGTAGSTIVDATGDALKLIREGEIPSHEIFQP
ncbi:MAG: threonylcarbamoyl-AMP synthase [Deltaproteobacteria bacterium GWA2_54_12]|nr:MAG: threonylcarbamoyl-AMP synthase [Deltaproteobacteria bacterium GWA2_54_12]